MIERSWALARALPALTVTAGLMSAATCQELRGAGGKQPRFLEQRCPPAPGGGVNISPDSIAYLRTDAPLRELKALCPGATPLRWSGGEANGESDSPALEFAWEDLTALALQHARQLDLDRPADAWILRGGGATLPGGVALGATWSELSKAFGTAVAMTGTSQLLHVMFCKIPQLGFAFTSDTIIDPARRVGHAALKEESRPVELTIVSRPDSVLRHAPC